MIGAEEDAEAYLQFTDLRDAFVNWYGRVFTGGGKVDFSASAAGFEVRFSGTELSAVIAASPSEAPSEAAGNAYLSVFLEGALAARIALKAGEESYTLLYGLAEGVHTVKVLKDTERKYGTAALCSLRTDGTFLPPPRRAALRFELVGDSILSGSECMRYAEEDSRITSSQNCLLGYGYLAAAAFKAEVNAVTRSGALVSEYMGLPSIPQEYERLCRGGGEWDFSRFRPDVILLDLGTNDVLIEVPKDLLFRDYLAFLRKVRERNPNSLIVCCEGAMTASLHSLVGEAVQTLMREGDTRILAFRLPCTHTSGGHPTVREHQQNGEALAAFLAGHLLTR